MSEHNITVAGGTSVRLATAGKYCDRDIIITAEGSSEPAVDLTAELTEQEELISQIKTALEDKALGGGGETPTQVKIADITENGVVEILPDEGYALSKVIANVNVGEGNPEEEIAKMLMNTLTHLDNSVATSLRQRALQTATKLQTVNLPNVTTVGNYAFYGCSGLLTVNLNKATSVPSQCFYTCTSLQKVDLGAAASIASQSFNACSALTVLILRKSDAICTLSNSNAISNSPIGKGTGYIYVPSALVDTYKTATNWSTFADQFRAIEDYPDITGG